MTARILFLFPAAVALAGCLHVKVDPLEVKPITLNVNLKVDRELDDMFAGEHPATQPLTTAPATLPAK